jgi:hypothetical protein
MKLKYIDTKNNHGYALLYRPVKKGMGWRYASNSIADLSSVVALAKNIKQDYPCRVVFSITEEFTTYKHYKLLNI